MTISNRQEPLPLLRAAEDAAGVKSNSRLLSYVRSSWGHVAKLHTKFRSVIWAMNEGPTKQARYT